MCTALQKMSCRHSRIHSISGESYRGGKEATFFSWVGSGNPQEITAHTRVGTLIVATIYLQLIPNRYMFRSFTALQCSHQHCVQPVASDVEVVGYL